MSYNVTVHYWTAAGERIFTDSHTTGQLSNDNSDNSDTLGIPLYNANSSYVIQVTAVLDDGERITSNHYTTSAGEFAAHMGRNGTLIDGGKL